MLISAGVLASENEHSAILTDMQGNVLVNEGQDYKKARINQEFRDNDLILMRAGDWIEISYDNGCDERIEGPNIYIVHEDKCGAKAPLVDNDVTAPDWDSPVIECGQACDDIDEPLVIGR